MSHRYYARAKGFGWEVRDLDTVVPDRRIGVNIGAHVRDFQTSSECDWTTAHDQALAFIEELSKESA